MQSFFLLWLPWSQADERLPHEAISWEEHNGEAVLSVYFWLKKRKKLWVHSEIERKWWSRDREALATAPSVAKNME